MSVITVIWIRCGRAKTQVTTHPTMGLLAAKLRGNLKFMFLKFWLNPVFFFCFFIYFIWILSFVLIYYILCFLILADFFFFCHLRYLVSTQCRLDWSTVPVPEKSDRTWLNWSSSTCWVYLGPWGVSAGRRMARSSSWLWSLFK